MLDCLLCRWDPVRDVKDARGYYEKNRDDLICVWSDDKIARRNFDVDHVLPYTLWKNNDLWNLLPALSTLNNQKRDSIPSRSLLKARRDVIITHWQGLKTEFGPRFDRDAQTLMGRQSFDPGNWKLSLYSRLSEACEVTATQRGAHRWQPEDFEEESPAVTRHAPVPKSAPYGFAPSAPMIVYEEANNPSNIFCFEDIAQAAYQEYLPLVGNLAAGGPFHGFAEDGLEDPTVLDWLKIPSRLCGKKRFIVRVAGDSMEPTLPQGSLAVFEYHRRPSEARKIVIANLPSFGITGDGFGTEAIKYFTQDATHWIFESDNPAYETIRVSKIDCPQHPILGEFVAVV